MQVRNYSFQCFLTCCTGLLYDLHICACCECVLLIKMTCAVNWIIVRERRAESTSLSHPDLAGSRGVRTIYLLTCATCEYSDQPVHPRSLIRVFVVNMNKLDHWIPRAPCNFDPLQPHLYIVKLGFTGVYIIFLISAQNHRLWVLVRAASMFWAVIWNISEILSENFQFWVMKFSIYLNRCVFVMQWIF